MDQPRLFIKDPQDNLITVISEGYFNVELTSYLTGAATTLSFSFVKDEDSYEQIVTGCKVAFIYKGKDYWMNIVRVSQDEDIMTVTAWGVSLELSNETVAPYKATKPMSFAEYANLWNYEKTFEIGINEVSDKKITHEWEGADKTLGRLLSLATVFDAEVEFVTYLDDFHNLDRLVMNVYKAHSETNQGLGLDSRQMVFRFGNEIETVSKEESAEELYTAITPTGKDGLNISSIEFEKFDADGNLEFCTYKTAKPNFPDVRKIYAPLAKLRHPSYRGQTRDEWTNFNWETEYTTANDLSGNALSKLKTISAPVFTWDIVGVIDAGIGDTVTIEDDGYEPTLYLEARVSEQTIDFSDESKNKTTFTNVLEVGSAVDMSLLSRMEALIEANKTYVGSIQTTNGIVFKNNTGTTDLTAVVRIGTQTVTDDYDIFWYKDGTEIANTTTITVTATDVVEKALYKFEAKDADGVLVASYEVTVSDVSDGEKGRGISSTKVEYQASSSGTTVPTGTWLTNPPSVTDGQFLWTRTTFTYTDNTTTLSYSISRMGTTGTNGVGISDVAVTYQAGTSGTTPPTGTWTTTIPSVTANQYLWTRTVTTYTDSSTSTAYSVGKMGANGANAQLLYLSASANVMSFDSNDIVEPNQTVTITAKLQNATGTIVWTAIPYIGNAAQTPITLSGTGNSRTLTSGNWTNPNWTSVAVTATLGSLTDTISVVKVADGAAAHVHTAWMMPDGTFTKVYPNENLLQTTSSVSTIVGTGNPNQTDARTAYTLLTTPFNTLWTDMKVGDTFTFSCDVTVSGSGFAGRFRPQTLFMPYTALLPVYMVTKAETVRVSFTGVVTQALIDSLTVTAIQIRYDDIPETVSLTISKPKLERGSIATIYTPSPSEDLTNAYPKWEGSYSDNIETASDNPADYEPWKIIRGEDGIAGKDGVGLSSTTITYAQSTTGTTPPTTGWSDQVPTLVKGQYLWTRTVWTYTDNSTETGYTVSYNAKDGNDGEDGIAGKDGVGISNTVIEYVGAVSGTSKPTSGWSTTIPTVPAGQYLWTRTTWQYTDGTSEQGFTNALMGRTGASGKDGVAGKDGVGIKSTQIMYAQSTSGTTAPSTGWNEQVPTLIKGQYLWTQTTWVYTDNTGEAGYTVSYNAKDGNDGNDGIAGKDGVGISNTKIEYVGSTSGTTRPTSGWSTTIPTVAEGNFLWTRTTWTYTDNTSEVGYSVAKMGAKGDKGVDGKTPYTRWAYAWSADGTDRFTTTYPNENLFVGSVSEYRTASVGSWNGGMGFTSLLEDIGVKVGDSITLSAYFKNPTTATDSVSARINFVRADETYTNVSGNYIKPGEEGRSTVSGTIPTGTVRITCYIQRTGGSSTAPSFTTQIMKEKLEIGNYATIYTPAPSEDFANASPTYAGTYTDYEPTDSEDPSKYTWQRILGESGQDGKDGADGKDAQEVFSGYLTNESIVLPANAAGTVTDFSKANGTFVTFLGQNQLSTGVAYSLESATGITTTINATSGAYSVTAISADVGVAIYKAVYSGVTIRKQLMVVRARQGATGANGTNGSDGKDGVGVTNTVITYQAGSSGTTAPSGTWTSTIPSVSASQYLWTRTVWTFSDGTSKTGYSIGKIGDNGAKGDTGATGATGATGNGIASAAITYANSASGTTVPTSGWVTTIPSVPAGNFLWTRTIFTYTNGNTNTSYAVAKQGEKGDPTGILSQNTVPAAAQRYVGMLWKNTGAAGYINGATYRWNGSAFELYIFTAENISVSNLAAISANLGTITAGTINGVTINGSEFINPYTRSYNDGTFAQGTQRIGSAELYNSGVIKNSQGTTTQSYEAIFSHQLVSMTRYRGASLGDQNELIAAMGLTFDSLTLNNQQTGFAGTLTAEMLYDTGWLKVTRLKGTAGDIYLKRYMNRILIRFDQFVWNGSANGASTNNAVAILPDKVREGFPQMFTVPVWVEGSATEKFQVENGRLYKLSNNSGNSRITAVGEVYI
ncbi:hypothetical protein EC55P2_00092 [Enterococcus phage EC55P2]|nr:hypothetical protein EC55P2_00092 [Enterococcus phage EC55P2]